MGTAHYLAMMVIVVSLTRNCSGFGDPCSDNSNCTTTGEVCGWSSSCVCNSTTHFQETVGSQPKCSPKMNFATLLKKYTTTDMNRECCFIADLPGEHDLLEEVFQITSMFKAPPSLAYADGNSNTIHIHPNPGTHISEYTRDAVQVELKISEKEEKNCGAKKGKDRSTRIAINDTHGQNAGQDQCIMYMNETASQHTKAKSYNHPLLKAGRAKINLMRFWLYITVPTITSPLSVVEKIRRNSKIMSNCEQLKGQFRKILDFPAQSFHFTDIFVYPAKRRGRKTHNFSRAQLRRQVQQQQQEQQAEEQRRHPIQCTEGSEIQDRESDQHQQQVQQQQQEQQAEEQPRHPIQCTEGLEILDSEPRPYGDFISTRPVFSDWATHAPLPETPNLIIPYSQERVPLDRVQGQGKNGTKGGGGRTTPRHPQYQDQAARQGSFTNWPASAHQAPARMIMFGFFYTGREDLVRCHHCGIGLKDWSDGDEPLFEHIKHSPNCLFLRKLLGKQLLNTYRENLAQAQRNNETARSQDPIETDAAKAVLDMGYSRAAVRLAIHEFNWRNPSQRKLSFTADELVQILVGRQERGEPIPDDNNDQEERESVPRPAQQHTRRVRHPGMTTIGQRLGTFNEWPQSTEQLPQPLAEAGLFFTGINDLCRCFTCDGGLQGWDRDDDPWLEHTRWFPHCSNVREMNGQEYIDMVQFAAQRAYLEEEESVVVRGLTNLDFQNTDLMESDAAKAVLEIGYSRAAVRLAIHEFNERNPSQRTLRFTADELVQILAGRQERGEPIPDDDTDPEEQDPMEENKRLKGNLKCIMCKENDGNILLLPCAHHYFCERCAENITNCPVCGRRVADTIRTYMA